MGYIKNDFKEFCNNFTYLDIKELIENFAVFGGLDFGSIVLDSDMIINIQNNIIQNYTELKKRFSLDKDKELILKKLAGGDRKQYSLYRNSKDISQIRGRILHKELYSENIIEKELTREKRLKRGKNRYIKKEYRGYFPEDKLRFVKNFDRFWFTFISPFSDDLDKGREENCINAVKNGFEKYVSLTFEELSNELIKESIWGLNIVESGGYWDINTEYDLLAKDTSGRYIIGECKWTNQKICKNTLRKLQNKAKNLDFDIINFALFSKNGFSESLKKEKDVLLFDIKDFKELLQ
jgi:hypothetical protein